MIINTLAPMLNIEPEEKVSGFDSTQITCRAYNRPNENHKASHEKLLKGFIKQIKCSTIFNIQLQPELHYHHHHISKPNEITYMIRKFYAFLFMGKPYNTNSALIKLITPSHTIHIPSYCTEETRNSFPTCCLSLATTESDTINVIFTVVLSIKSRCQYLSVQLLARS